ncbi:hypothetical protein TNCT_567031 [Trichonephila clavata]|uniref:Uncharacterized protein n=1 Tax=Trichonephila clavata TaxID=2740835 RepID=A0A8X6EXN0_TRICU|nr:hypothetical protein TNCT_567031 [Trichonephila clavata]
MGQRSREKEQEQQGTNQHKTHVGSLLTSNAKTCSSTASLEQCFGRHSRRLAHWTVPAAQCYWAYLFLATNPTCELLDTAHVLLRHCNTPCGASMTEAPTHYGISLRENYLNVIFGQWRISRRSGPIHCPDLQCKDPM